MKTIRHTIITVFMLSVFGLLLSCQSVKLTVDQNWVEENFFVAAQDAADNSNYDQSLFYYQVYMTRYPENFRKVVAARYEIGFMYYKQGRYKRARRELEAVMDIYETSPYVIFLEERYRILSESVLKEIGDKEDKKTILDIF